MIPAEQLLRGGPPESATLDRPLDHLVACHRRIEQRLATLERVGDHLETRPQEVREALAACFRFFDTNGVFHTQDEEQSLFPRLRPRITATKQYYLWYYLERLEQEHAEADQVYVQLKELAGRLTPAGAESFRQLAFRLASLYRSHIASEDQVLVEIARRVLPPGDLEQISQEMKRRRGL